MPTQKTTAPRRGWRAKRGRGGHTPSRHRARDRVHVASSRADVCGTTNARRAASGEAPRRRPHTGGTVRGFIRVLLLVRLDSVLVTWWRRHRLCVERQTRGRGRARACEHGTDLGQKRKAKGEAVDESIYETAIDRTPRFSSSQSNLKSYLRAFEIE